MKRRLLTQGAGGHQVIDESTGEVISSHEDAPLVVLVPNREKRTRDFIPVNQHAIFSLASLGLRGKTCSVLFVMMYCTDFENQIMLSGAAIAAILKISAQAVSFHTKILEKHNVIVKRTTKFGMLRWHISSDLAWKGTVESLKKTQQRELVERFGKH